MLNVLIMDNLIPWVVVSPSGLSYLHLAKDEDDVWRIYLGWPNENEIEAAKKQGYYAEKATVYWKKDIGIERT